MIPLLRLNSELEKKVKELLDPIIDCQSRCVEHYTFWLLMAIDGQVKGGMGFKHIAEIYKKKGYIRVEGRGRNSKYVANYSVMPIMNTLKEILQNYVGEIRRLELPKKMVKVVE